MVSVSILKYLLLKSALLRSWQCDCVFSMISLISSCPEQIGPTSHSPFFIDIESENVATAVDINTCVKCQVNFLEDEKLYTIKDGLTELTEYSKWIESSHHCVKRVQIWSFFWFVFSCLWTEHGPDKNLCLDTFHAVHLTSFLKENCDAGLIKFHRDYQKDMYNALKRKTTEPICTPRECKPVQGESINFSCKRDCFYCKEECKVDPHNPKKIDWCEVRTLPMKENILHEWLIKKDEQSEALSMQLLWKSSDWFLYGGNIGR